MPTTLGSTMITWSASLGIVIGPQGCILGPLCFLFKHTGGSWNRGPLDHWLAFFHFECCVPKYDGVTKTLKRHSNTAKAKTFCYHPDKRCFALLCWTCLSPCEHINGLKLPLYTPYFSSTGISSENELNLQCSSSKCFCCLMSSVDSWPHYNVSYMHQKPSYWRRNLDRSPIFI